MIIITDAKLYNRSVFNILVFSLLLMLFINLIQFKIGFSQTEPTNSEEGNNNRDTVENKTTANEIEDQNSEIAAAMETDNSSSIDPEEEKIRRKAMTMILNISKVNNPFTNKQSPTIFNLNEQRNKDRKKRKREMKNYNQRYNKQINDFFQRFQKKRYQSASYNGKHDDYTSYIQNFQSNIRR